MYGRHTTMLKIVFGAMAFVMAVGFPLSLMIGLPGFQSLFTGEDSTTPQSIIDEKRKELKKYPFDPQNPKKYAKNKKRHLAALRSIGAASVAQASPDPVTNEPPTNASEYYSQAIEAYQLYLKIDPKEPKIMAALADAYDNKSLPIESVKLWEKLSKLNPEEEAYLYRWGRAAESNNDKLTAIQAYRKYLALNPDAQNAEIVREMIANLKKPADDGLNAQIG